MATKIWRGDAPAVAQVDTLTVGGTIEADDVFNMTINGKTLSVVGGSTTAATVATNIATAWNALSAAVYPEFAEITAAATSGGALTLTADTAGKPFTVTVETTETGGGAADSQTFGRSATTANSGPNCADVSANWSGGTPVDGDDVVIDESSSSLLYGLDLSTVTPASITIGPKFTGEIGLPVVNEDNANGNYYEYRDTYLTFCDAGDTTNTAIAIDTVSRLIKLSTNDGQATIVVSETGQPLANGDRSLYWKGSHTSNSLTVSKGNVGVAALPGETAALAALNVGYQQSVQGDANVLCGSGVSFGSSAAIKQSGGNLELNSATTSSATITQTNGTLIVQSGGQVGLSVLGGKCVYNSTGTLGGAPVVSGDGHLDFSQDLRVKTVTNPIEVYGKSAKVSDPHKVVSSLVLDLNQTENTANLIIGSNIRITRGATA